MIAKLCYILALVLTVGVAIEGFLFVIFPTDDVLNHAGKIFYWLYVDNTNTTNILHKFPLVEWDMIMFSQQYIAFYTHVSLGPIALVAGFFQLNNKLRKQKPALHRWIGNLYLFCQLFSIPAGIWLGLHEYAGIAAVYGFIGMGGSTLLSSAFAYYYIRFGDYETHREWMIRSYFIMWSSVVLFRLGIMYWIPLEVRRFGGTLPNDFKDPFVVCIFLSWSLGLLGADIYLSYTKPKKTKTN